MNAKIFKKVESLAREVRESLRRQGLVVPVKNQDGSISVDRYRIVKRTSGFYSILDHDDEVIVDLINLPQSAALLANNLALGRFVDSEILNFDRYYGYNLFEEQLSRQHAESNLKKKNIDRADFLFTKCKIAKLKRMDAKRAIMHSFDKLRRPR